MPKTIEQKHLATFSITENDFPELFGIIVGEKVTKKIGDHFIFLENKINKNGKKRIDINSPITTITKSYITSIKKLITDETPVDLEKSIPITKKDHQYFFVREKNLHKYEKDYEILVEKEIINTLRKKGTKIETLQKKYNQDLENVFSNKKLVTIEEFSKLINANYFSTASLLNKILKAIKPTQTYYCSRMNDLLDDVCVPVVGCFGCFGCLCLAALSCIK